MNEVLVCRGLFAEPKVLLSVAIIVLGLFLFFDFCVGKKKVLEVESGRYLDRVSNYELKLWVAEEHYRQQNYGIHLMSDASFNLLC